MPRLIEEQKVFDYKTEYEFMKHAIDMRNRGWILREKHDIGDEHYAYKYCATYERGVLVNGVNGRGKH